MEAISILLLDACMSDKTEGVMSTLLRWFPCTRDASWLADEFGVYTLCLLLTLK